MFHWKPLEYSYFLFYFKYETMSKYIVISQTCPKLFSGNILHGMVSMSTKLY